MVEGLTVHLRSREVEGLAAEARATAASSTKLKVGGEDTEDAGRRRGEVDELGLGLGFSRTKTATKMDSSNKRHGKNAPPYPRQCWTGLCLGSKDTRAKCLQLNKLRRLPKDLDASQCCTGGRGAVSDLACV